MPDGELPPGDPSVLLANAWCGTAASAARGAEFDQWGLRKDRRARPRQALAPQALDLENWRDPRVGWGLVLPERDDLSGEDKARAADAPGCIQELLARRSQPFGAQGGAPVFRYRAELESGLLRRYAAAGAPSDPGLGGLRGVGPNAVPWYLLIVGSPAEIPWRFQYRLQLDAFVGRLDLEPDGLERYVEALLGDWSQTALDARKPVVWAVDHGAQDITHLMRRTIADRLAKAFGADAELDMAGGVLADAGATCAGLAAALAERRPAFVATTSHGATFPLDDSAAMAAQLGLPVDSAHAPLDPAVLTSVWSPHGAIWYAHACCSAGCDAASSFAGAASADSALGRTLTALTQLGARSAPLPKHLLGGPRPARAFIGHVEPTFDWTLRDPRNGQTTTAHIVQALYDRLHLASRPPIGHALETYHKGIGGLWRDYVDAGEELDAHVAGADERVRRAKLVACDREAMVLLGDPTVRCG